MPLGLFGTIGTPELVVILIVALLMFGGRLPEVARSVGKSVNQFKKGLKDVEDDVQASMADPPATPKALPPRADAPTATVTAPVEPTKTPEA